MKKQLLLLNTKKHDLIFIGIKICNNINLYKILSLGKNKNNEINKMKKTHKMFFHKSNKKLIINIKGCLFLNKNFQY